MTDVDKQIDSVAARLMNEFDMRAGFGASKCRNVAREIVESLAPAIEATAVTREQIIAEIMKLVRPEPKPLERPTIAELEKILNSETTDAVQINTDGSVSTRPTTTTVGAVADAILALTNGIRK